MKKIAFIMLIAYFAACKSHPAGGETFPAFDILLADSVTRVNTGLITKGNPIVLIYFSPDCEHCQKETESILQHIQSLKGVRFYFITSDPFERLRAFKGYYKLNQYPNIIIGRDEQFFIIRHFKGAYPPYLVFYDQEKYQRAVYQGDTPVDTIISFVNHLKL